MSFWDYGHTPDRINCGHGCKDQGFPVEAKLDKTEYRFRNTGQPYRLYECPKCKRTTMFLPFGDSPVINPVGLSRTRSRIVT